MQFRSNVALKCEINEVNRWKDIGHRNAIQNRGNIISLWCNTTKTTNYHIHLN